MTVTITGWTSEHLQEIIDGLIDSAHLSGDNLIVVDHDGTTHDLGSVRGATGTTPNFVASSTSSVAIGTGSKTFALTGLTVAFPVGSVVRIAGSTPTNYMVGYVTASSTTSVTVNVTETGGSGTLTSWTLTIGAFKGTDGTVSNATLKAKVVGGSVIALGNLTGSVNMSTVGSSALTTDTAVNATVTATLTGNTTFTKATMPTVDAGTQFTMLIKQDVTGSRTLTLTNILKPNGTLALSTAANAVDMLVFFYDGTDWYATIAKSFSA